MSDEFVWPSDLKRLQRAARAQAELLDRIYQYVDDQGLAKLGESKVTALIEAHRQAVAERNALAAHVEAIRQAWPYRVGVGLPQTLRKLGAALDEPPSTPLTRLIAEKQAEELDIFAIHCREKAHQAAEAGHMMQADAVCDVADDANNRAAELRRQAEGGE